MRFIKKTAPLAVALVLVASAAGAAPFTVTSSITDGQTLTGSLRWTATPSTSAVSTVDFFVDGVNKSTEQSAPYVYGGDQGMLDTTPLKDGSHVFAVTATATDGTKASVTATATTRNAPVNTRRPSISGTARDGSILGLDRGAWTGAGSLAYSYSWLRCDSAGNGCAAISGATGSSYRATAADVGHRLRVTVTASDSAGATAATSDPTGSVAARGSAPTAASAPGISGSAREGSVLTASPGSWRNSPTAFAYQWLRCDANGGSCGGIGGANARQYTLTTGDVGRRLRVAVTASNAFGTGTATSNATGAVAARGSAPTAASVPGISGTARDGAVLTASPGSWRNSPTSYAYQWLRCDANGGSCGGIGGANSRQYTLTTGDVGRRLRVAVTASNAFGAGTATSNATGTVQATGTAPANMSPPSLAGTTKEGGKLDVNNGSWSGNQPIAFSYVWRRCDANGNACADIPGATSSSYVQTSADVAHTLRVAVTARNARGAAAATSAQSGLVTPAKRGAQALDVAQVGLPDTLVIDRVRFSPNPVRSRLAPIVARFHVSDSRGFSIAGAQVLALGLPYSWARSAPEAMTDGAGWATVVMRAGASLPRRGALVVFVRARKPGENVLGGVTARRLVQVGIRR